jgi:hypothetical protein
LPLIRLPCILDHFLEPQLYHLFILPVFALQQILLGALLDLPSLVLEGLRHDDLVLLGIDLPILKQLQDGLLLLEQLVEEGGVDLAAGQEFIKGAEHPDGVGVNRAHFGLRIFGNYNDRDNQV